MNHRVRNPNLAQVGESRLELPMILHLRIYLFLSLNEPSGDTLNLNIGMISTLDLNTPSPAHSVLDAERPSMCENQAGQSWLRGEMGAGTRWKM